MSDFWRRLRQEIADRINDAPPPPRQDVVNSFNNPVYARRASAEVDRQTALQNLEDQRFAGTTQQADAAAGLPPDVYNPTAYDFPYLGETGPTQFNDAASQQFLDALNRTRGGGIYRGMPATPDISPEERMASYQEARRRWAEQEHDRLRTAQERHRTALRERPLSNAFPQVPRTTVNHPTDYRGFPTDRGVQDAIREQAGAAYSAGLGPNREVQVLDAVPLRRDRTE